MKRVYLVEGMSCGHCVMSVRKELNKLNLKNYDVVIGKVILDSTNNGATKEEVSHAIKEAGYKVTEISDLPVD